MADQLQQTTTGTPGSMAPLVAGIIDDLQELIKQNLSLFKVEVREDFKKTKEAAASLGVGIGLAVVGALHLTLMLVFLLWWAFDSAARSASGLPLWVCFAIVGGVFTGVGVALYFKGKKKLDSFNPLPDETADALKENVQWIKNRI
jgi:uncharacterized membrane protein YqjE